MVLWALAALINPNWVTRDVGGTSLLNPDSASHLALGLAMVAAALLLFAAAGLPVLAPTVSAWAVTVGRRSRTAARPRLLNPNAAGRPRPRAPTGRPATV